MVVILLVVGPIYIDYTNLNHTHYHYHMPRILAFDIGIKNLAWCCLENNTVLGWDNYNLMSDSSNIGPVTKQTCSNCKAKGVYDISGTKVCSRHCPTSRPAFRDLSGNILKKIPPMKTLREILNKVPGLHKSPAKKDDIVNELSKWYSIPIQEAKVPKAPDVGLTAIHTSIQKLVKEQEPLWKTCTLILLENQPAFKNPTMKSVQMLLFATLRDLLPSPPPLKLVHAGKKVQVEEKGDAGYKDRKSASEARVAKYLKEHPQKSWDSKWSQAAKKSDLADALCMCLDASV